MSLFHAGSEELHDLLQWFTKWAIRTRLQEPHQFSKGPQGNDGKLGGHSNFGVGHWDLSAWIKYFQYTRHSKVPLSPAYPKVQKAKLRFIAFLTPYLVESSFSWVTYLLSKVSNPLDVVSLVTGHTFKILHCSPGSRNTLDIKPIVNRILLLVQVNSVLYLNRILTNNTIIVINVNIS